MRFPGNGLQATSTASGSMTQHLRQQYREEPGALLWANETLQASQVKVRHCMRALDIKTFKKTL